ncbi:hypothetical protein C2G38_2074562, partial [Gigaspora rosea]
IICLTMHIICYSFLVISCTTLTNVCALFDSVSITHSNPQMIYFFAFLHYAIICFVVSCASLGSIGDFPFYFPCD